MDVNKLLKALENDSNENMLNFTTAKLREMNEQIISELQLSRKETLDILYKLKDYKYVDEMNDLKYGTYIRWIPIDDPKNIHLTKGAIFCEMKITDEGVFCVCKNFGFKSKTNFFQIVMDKNLIFQKLTSQEKVLLSALDHLVT
jgi:hypothetical protein